MMLDAAAPTNLPWANPAVWKEAFDTGGQSLVAGAANFVDDLMHNRGRPTAGRHNVLPSSARTWRRRHAGS